MATTTAADAVLNRQAPLPVPSGRAGFAGALRSEFTKIRSVRSTYWTLLALVIAVIGIGALFCLGQASHVAQAAGQNFYKQQQAQARTHSIPASLFGLLIGQLIIVVLGALTITSEYATGMIRTSLTMMPRRGTVFAAKATVFTTVTLVVSLIASFASFLIGQAILNTQHVGMSIGAPGALRSVIGGALFLAACGLLSFGFGAMLRHTAAAITTSIGLLFVVWILSNFLPGPPSGWFGAADIDKWIPFNAGAAVWEHFTGTNMFSPWIGFAVFCCYAAAAVIAGLVVFLRRDA